MDVLATGVQRDERPPLEAAFCRRAARHPLLLETTSPPDTLPLAARLRGGLHSSVNAVLDAPVLEALVSGGTRLITQRSTGYNNIDLAHAERLGMTVARVAAYSPYAVAEFAWTLALALEPPDRLPPPHPRLRLPARRRAASAGTLHGRTVGVIGTGRIGAPPSPRSPAASATWLLGRDITPNPECEEMGNTQYAELDGSSGRRTC